MRNTPDPRIAHLLYEALVTNPVAHLPTIAHRSGLSVAKLYSLAEGVRHVLAADVAALYRGTRNVTLVSDMLGLGDLGLVLTEAPTAAETLTDSRRSSACKVAAAAGQVASLVDAAEADGVVTQQEHEAIEAAVDQLERTAEQLRKLLHQEGPIRAVRSGR